MPLDTRRAIRLCRSSVRSASGISLLRVGTAVGFMCAMQVITANYVQRQVTNQWSNRNPTAETRRRGETAEIRSASLRLRGEIILLQRLPPVWPSRTTRPIRTSQFDAAYL